MSVAQPRSDGALRLAKKKARQEALIARRGVAKQGENQVSRRPRNYRILAEIQDHQQIVAETCVNAEASW